MQHMEMIGYTPQAATCVSARPHLCSPLSAGSGQFGMRVAKTRQLRPRLLRRIARYTVRRILLLICIPLHVLFATPAQADTDAAPPNQPQLKIGILLPLTGPTADYGIAIRNALELAREGSPDKFSSIRFIYEDVAYDPKLAVAGFQRLTRVEGVSLVYVWGVTFCKVIAPLAESSKIPMVGQCIDPEVGRGKEFVVRFMGYTDQYLRETVRYLDRRKLSKIALVLTDNAYLDEMHRALERSLLPGQKIVMLQRFQPLEMDFRSVIAAIRQSEADVVGVFVGAGQISAFFKQLKTVKVTLPTFGTNFFESSTEIALAQGAMEGAVYSGNRVHSTFIDRYRSRYGALAQVSFAALAYEFSEAVSAIVASAPAGLLTGRRVLEELKRIRNHPGVAAGPYSAQFSPLMGWYFDFPVGVKEVVGQECREVGHSS